MYGPNSKDVSFLALFAETGNFGRISHLPDHGPVKSLQFAKSRFLTRLWFHSRVSQTSDCAPLVSNVQPKPKVPD